MPRLGPYIAALGAATAAAWSFDRSVDRRVVSKAGMGRLSQTQPEMGLRIPD